MIDAIIVIVAVLALLGFFEWRSRNKPLPAGLTNHWSVHSAAQNDSRSTSGGHDAGGAGLG